MEGRDEMNSGGRRQATGRTVHQNVVPFNSVTLVVMRKRHTKIRRQTSLNDFTAWNEYLKLLWRYKDMQCFLTCTKIWVV